MNPARIASRKLKILEMLWPELRLILKTSAVTPDFFTSFIESYHFLPSVKVLKKSVWGKFLGANVLNCTGSAE